jgi:hypothetical protein
MVGIYRSKAERSKGTLLTLPARYFLGMPLKSRGLGNWLSSTNRHLESWIRTGGRGVSWGMYDELDRVVDIVRLLERFPPLILEPRV